MGFRAIGQGRSVFIRFDSVFVDSKKTVSVLAVVCGATTPNGNLFCRKVAWFILAGPALFFMFSLTQQPHATLGTEFTGPDGRNMILLEPETWIGKEFPLISRLVEPEGSEVLLEGTWQVLLVQPDCSDCHLKLAELESRTPRPETVAIVVIPSRIDREIQQTSFPTFVLDRQNGWFVETPVAVKLVEGVCVEIGEGIEE